MATIETYSQMDDFEQAHGPSPSDEAPHEPEPSDEVERQDELIGRKVIEELGTRGWLIGTIISVQNSTSTQPNDTLFM